MECKSLITMEGSQALNLAKIHPTKCGTVFYRTKQLRSWMLAHDELANLDSRKDLVIGCNAPISSLDDLRSFIDSFMAHVLDGNRQLALVIDGERYVISIDHEVAGKGYRVHYDVQNGRRWVRQCRQGWLFPRAPCVMFDTLLGGMLSDNWSSLPTENMITE